MKPIIYFRFEEFISQTPHSIECYTYLDRTKFGNFMIGQPFRFSQVVDNLLYYYKNNPNSEETIMFESIDSKNNNGYIIPVGVYYCPYDWTDIDDGIRDNTRKSIFELINPKYLKDMQEGRALLLIDQSVEGYSTSWLWQWFHDKCKKYDLSPSCIVYLTGDQSCEDRYKEWCEENNITPSLKVIPSISLSVYIRKYCLNNQIIPDFKNLLEYKKVHVDNLYLYDCINRRPRTQRILNFINLIEEELIDRGNISMPDISEWATYFDTTTISSDLLLKIKNLTPKKTKFISTDNSPKYHNFVERVLFDLYKNSWVSLVTESTYFDYEYSVFIGEKTFKPIACMQPFIILGSKDSLKYLRKLGYKTFHPYIDETYDTLDDANRIKSIANTIKKIQAIEDKIEWYRTIKEIVEYNYNVFLKIGVSRSIEHEEITKYYFDYFGGKGVHDDTL